MHQRTVTYFVINFIGDYQKSLSNFTSLQKKSSQDNQQPFQNDNLRSDHAS